MGDSNGRVRNFFSRVLTLEEWGVDIVRSAIINALVWLGTWIGGLTIATKVWFWVVMFVAVFVGLSLIQAILHPQSAPEIDGEISRLTVGEMNGDSIVMVEMTVYNRGTPTALDNWRGEVKVPGGEWRDLQPIHIQNPVMVNTGNQVARIEPEDTIYDRTLEPVDDGGIARGRMFFRAEGISSDNMRGAGIRVRVTFKDVKTGSEHTFSQETDEAERGVGYLPGLTSPDVVDNGIETDGGGSLTYSPGGDSD